MAQQVFRPVRDFFTYFATDDGYSPSSYMDYSQRVTVYSPDSGLRNPRQFFRDFWSDVRNSRELAYQMFLRNLRARYRQSFLGFAWAIIPAIITTAVWVFLQDQKVLQIEETNVPYPAFVLTGTLLWQMFVSSLNGPQMMVNSQKSLMAKLNFPREALLLAGFYQNGLDILIRLALLIPVYFLFDVSVTTSALLAPIGIVAILMFGTTLGLLLLPVGMLYTDVNQLVGAVIPFLFFLTPIIYPTPREGVAALVGKYNPMGPLINVTRGWLTGDEVLHLGVFWAIVVSSVVLLFVSLLIFRLALPRLIERIGA